MALFNNCLPVCTITCQCFTSTYTYLPVFARILCTLVRYTFKQGPVLATKFVVAHSLHSRLGALLLLKPKSNKEQTRSSGCDRSYLVVKKFLLVHYQCGQRWSFPTKVVVFERKKSEKFPVVGGRFCGRFRDPLVATTLSKI